MKPAIFNTAMVKAILHGRKTNTRRPFTFKKCIRDYVKSMGQDYCLKHQNNLHGEYDWSIRERSAVWADYTHQQFLDEYAPYKVGDIIYVRETFCIGKYEGVYNGEGCNDSLAICQCLGDNDVIYFADAVEIIDSEYLKGEDGAVWKPSIHMPKEYARLFLRVKDVRIERLNEISHEDSIKEGIIKDKEHESWILGWKNYSRNVAENEFMTPCGSFKSLWESIYGDGSFDNRYVWVIEFERISKEEAING